MKRNFISLAIASAFAAFALTSCGEDSPNNPVPDPEDVTKAKFHNQKFEGNGIVFEIEPQGELDPIRYAFSIEGKDIFHDKNMNGKKDADEKLDNNFKGFLEMPAKNNKGLFVILGDVHKIKFLYQYGSFNRNDIKKPNCVKSSNFDGAKCLTITHLEWGAAGLTELVLNRKDNIKSLRLSINYLKDKNLFRGLDNLEDLDVNFNNFSGDIDLRHLTKIKRGLLVGGNVEANFILPEKSEADHVDIRSIKIKSFNPSQYPNLDYINMHLIDKDVVKEVIENLPDRNGKEKGQVVITREEYEKHKEKLEKKNWEAYVL